MLRADQVLAPGEWTGPPDDTVCLDYDHRHRRRIRLTGEGGQPFLLDLAEVPSLAEGDALRLSDGRVVAVRCAEEALLEVAATDARTLARLAWHLGNRHLPTQIGEGFLRLREDHVIERMLRGLGAQVRAVRAPFHPEGGAYGRGRVHGHDQGRGHSHGHDHGHAHHHAHHHAHDDRARDHGQGNSRVDSSHD